MNVSLLIKGGLIIDPAENREYRADISIEDGDISAISADLKPSGAQAVLDASNLWISAGFVDLHTHLRDFGQSDAEDISTGTQAAAAGGYTCVTAMANTDPPIDNGAMLSLLLRRIEEKARVEVIPVTCVTRGAEGVELVNMVEMSDLGAEAFSDDGMPLSNLAVLSRALEYAKLARRTIISHPEDKNLSAGGAIHDSLTSTNMGLPGIPSSAETAAIAREIEVVRQTGGRLHFAHVSAAPSVQLIRTAKADGLPVTADATPHHVCLTVNDITCFDTSFKMNPPLRTPTDQAAVVAGLIDGTIDAIATDHAPHTVLEKQKPFADAPFGVIGLETAFAVCLDRLVTTAHMSRIKFISLFTTRPAAVLDLPVPGIRTGEPANLVVIDPEHKWIYDANIGYSRSRNSPFHGRMLTGRPLLTLYSGETAYKNESLVAPRLKTGVLAG